MKIALLGYRGFIGRSLLNSPTFSKDDFLLIGASQAIWEMEKDIRNNFLNCDAIIWAAGKVNPRLAEFRPDLVRKEFDDFTNILNFITEGTRSVYPKFVFLSSGGCTYTADRPPFREEDQALGVNLYGKMKIDLENSLADKIPNSVSARLSNIYGPGQPSGRGQGVIAEWFSTLQSGGALKVFGDLGSSRDYLHIDDTIDAIRILAGGEVTGVVNVGSGVQTTLQDLIKIFRKVSRTNLNFEFNSKRIFDRSAYYLSVEKAKDKLGWSPKIVLESGIKSLLDTLAQE